MNKCSFFRLNLNLNKLIKEHKDLTPLLIEIVEVLVINKSEKNFI